MNAFPMIRSCCEYLDGIVLRPTATLSLTTYNRNTGACSEQKSLSISTGVTLLRGMMMLAGGAVLLGSVMHCMRRTMRKKMLCAQKAVTKRPKK